MANHSPATGAAREAADPAHLGRTPDDRIETLRSDGDDSARAGELRGRCLHARRLRDRQPGLYRGRSMDWAGSGHNLWAFPTGMQRDGGGAGSITWTSSMAP